MLAFSSLCPSRTLADAAAPESDAARLERRKAEWAAVTSPQPVRRLRSTPPRELWRNKLARLGHDVSRIALTGGYLHELWYDQLSRDAQRLGLIHHRYNVYALEEALLRPELVRRLRALGLSTEGDYVDLRLRLAQHSDVFGPREEKTERTTSE